MAKQIRGKCRCCTKEYTRTGMIKHLNACTERNNMIHKETGKKTGYFELLISAKYMKDYWLVIEITDTASLKDLDQFIRDIWVECCGHLSAFYINGEQYESLPADISMWGEPSRDMNVQLKNILFEGMQMDYEYDFGSTTELCIKVIAHRDGKQGKDKIQILSRNNPPKIPCSICQEKQAEWVNPEGFYDGNPFWCRECLEKAENGDCGMDGESPDAPDYYLPVCNSPRMGVCGYEGSEYYPE